MTALLNKNKNIYVFFLLMAVFLAIYTIILSLLGLHRDCWHDECHFTETVRLFIVHPSINTLIHYDEMSTPLPFILYAIWGAVFGDSLACLRLFSLIIALITYCSFFYLFLKELALPKTAFFLTVFLALNPYMAGAGIFVFTDMFSMLFVALLLLAIRNRSPVLSLVASTGGLLCRQYFLFAVIAAIIYTIRCFYLRKKKRDLSTATALIASAFPLAVLFILWKGFCPVNSCKALYITAHVVFHPNSATLYSIQLFVYMLPVLCFFWKNIYLNRRRLFLALALCWSYWIFPVAVSAPAIVAGKFTVGYFHRLLRLLPGERFEQPIFFICFTLSLPIALSIISDTWKRFKSPDADFTLFLDLLIIAFFLVMPFSYLHWEKYFLPLLPIVALQIILRYKRHDDAQHMTSTKEHS
jgi:hypothetical protein